MRLEKKLKKLIAMGAIGLIAMGGLKGASALVKREEIKEEKVISRYTAQADVDYKVNVIPNILYDQAELGSDQTYVSAFVNTIKPKFEYTLTGEEDIEWTGQYRVEADLYAYYKEQEQNRVIWSKVKNIVPTTPVKLGKDQDKIAKEVTISFKDYNELAREIAEATKVNGNMALELRLIGDLESTFEGKPLKEEINLAIQIPMQSNYFNITKVGQNAQTKEITETVSVPTQLDQKGLMIGGLLIIMGIGVLICSKVVKEPTAQEKQRILVEKVFREHGSRLVGVSQIGAEWLGEATYLVNIEDLVKLADELQRPILYKHHRDLTKINQLYIEAQDKVYAYRLNKSQDLLEGEADNSEDQGNQ